MKWIVIIAFIVVGGAWVNFLNSDRRAPFATGALIGFLPFVISPWHLMVAPYAIPMWGGYCKGWEVSLIDVLSIAVLMSGRFKLKNVPLQWPIVLYVLAVAVTVPLAKYPMFAAGYAIQLARMLLAFMAVARLASGEYGARGVFTGLVSGLTLQGIFALQARLGGAIQSGGTFGHQNLLGYVTYMILLPSFALLMGGERWKRTATVGTIAGAAVIIITASRAAIMIAAVGIVATYLLCAVTNWNGRKGMFGFITLALMIVATPFAQQSLGRRFAAQGGQQQLFGADKEREQFESAAKAMIHDHPLGIGPNHYVYIANIGGYNNRAKITWAQGSRSTNVHNTYLLVEAETGFLGLLTLLGVLGGTIYSCTSAARKYKGRGYSELIVGVGSAVLCVALHNKFEWMFVTFQAQYVLFIAIGLGAGCIAQSRVPPRRRPPPPPRPAAPEDEDDTKIAERLFA